MPRSIENQVSYSGGEWSPQLDARIDHPKYSQACRQLQNMIALRQGGATRRPGTIFKQECKYQDDDVHSFAARLMPFQFSPTTSFMLEMGHQYVRFYSNQEPVTLGSADGWVALTSYVVGDFVEDPGDSNNIYICKLAVSGSTQPHLDPTHWTESDIYEVVSPYTARVDNGTSIFTADVWGVVSCQINDVVYLVHPDYPPYKLVRLGDTNWTLTKVDFEVPALLDQNITDTTITPSQVTGSISLNASAPAWAAARFYDVGRTVLSSSVIYKRLIPGVSAATFLLDSAAGEWEVVTVFSSSHVGSRWQIKHLRDATFQKTDITGDNAGTTPIKVLGDWEVHTYGVWTADLAVQRSNDEGLTWETIRSIAGRSDRNADIKGRAIRTALYRMVITNWAAPTDPGATTPRVDFEINNSFLGGTVEITAVGNAYAATATVISELYAATASKYWSEAAWSGLRGYPRAITAFQQRMIYGASDYEPQRIWGTVTNDLENFDLGDQSQATDAFAFDIAAIGRGPIQWLIGQVDLFAGFTGAEWIINAGAGSFGGSGDPVTATAINAGEHSSFGSAVGVPPALAGNAVIYPQRSAKTIQQMMFSVYSNKYVSNDLSQLSEHLFGAGVAQLAYQPLFRNQGIVWAITKSKALCGMTYQAEQEVFAWHRHITGYNDPPGVLHRFESVAVIDGQDQDDDEVWVVVDRGSRYVELMNPANWETAGLGGNLSIAPLGVPKPEIKDAIFVDSAITVFDPATNVIGGLDHLVGLNVIGLINGNHAFGPVVVDGDGEITIPNFIPGEDPDTIQVGLPIYYKVQVMRLDVDPRGGVIMGIVKALSRVYLRLLNSLGGGVNDGGTKTIPIEYRKTVTPLGEYPDIFTGEKLITPVSNQSNDPVFIIQGSDPMPLTLLSTTVRIGIEGSA